MADPIVMFNLADVTGAEVLRARDNYALRMDRWYRKRREIKVYDLFAIFREAERGNLPITGGSDTVSIDQIRRDCRNAKKIILSTHGPYNGTDFTVLRDPQGALGEGDDGLDDVPNTQGNVLRVGLDDVTRMMRRFLDVNRSYYISLLICYAARTDNYAVDQFVTGEIHWETSFACRLFARLCQDRTAKLKMSARTGQHGYSRTTGLSEVQTEEAVRAEIECAALDGGLADWVDERMRGAFMPEAEEGALNAFCKDYFTAAALLQPPQKVAAMRNRLDGELGQALDEEDRQRFTEYVRKMDLDIVRSRTGTHYGKIYYHFDPRSRNVTIKKDRVTSKLKRHVQDTVQTTALELIP